MGLEVLGAIAAVAAVTGAGVTIGSALSQKKKKPERFPFGQPSSSAEITPEEKKAKVKAPSRLALISTSPQGVLNEGPVGRRKLLGN